LRKKHKNFFFKNIKKNNFPPKINFFLGTPVLVKWTDGLYYSVKISEPPADAPDIKKARQPSQQKYFVKFDNGDTDFISRDHIFLDDQDVAFFSDEEGKERKEKPTPAKKKYAPIIEVRKK
jgi:hypothetical protein